MKKNLLKLLEDDARLSIEQLSTMLDASKEDIEKELNDLEKDGIILGYKAMIDWEKTDREYVTAMIDVKLSPQRDRGFDKIADKLINYPEVQSVHLMSGGYDLMLIIEGKTMREVAFFVSFKLAPMEGVVSTATHFVLKKYKDKGVVYRAEPKDERESLL